MPEIQFFGEADKSYGERGAQKIASTYPGWYFDVHKENLKEDIAYNERLLEMDLVPKTEVNVTREKLSQKKKRLKEIEASRPKLSGPTKDRYMKLKDDLGSKIQESMFSRDEMKKGLADAHEEARRMSEPCIKLDSNDAELLRGMNIKMTPDGTSFKASRNQVTKAWKMLRKLSDESPNVESLRRD